MAKLCPYSYTNKILRLKHDINSYYDYTASIPQTSRQAHVNIITYAYTPAVNRIESPNATLKEAVTKYLWQHVHFASINEMMSRLLEDDFRHRRRRN